LCILGGPALWSTGFGAVADHVYWGQIVQGRIYDDPNLGPLCVVLIEFETDATVEAIEITTPAGYFDVIPSDDYTAYADTETFHWVSDATDRWEYWGYFEDSEALLAYGDGLYVFTVYYLNGPAEETSVWYGEPGTNEPIAAPTQRPDLVWPSYNGLAGSPVRFLWQPITDANVAEVYLGVVDVNGVHAAEATYDVDTVISDPYPLAEGVYDAELMFENFYPVTNPDGIPFDLLKTSMLFQPFEVTFSGVYRFWSSVTGAHFYTADDDEKNALLRESRNTWTYEGLAFYAWKTQYYADLSPVYRFRSIQPSVYLYTIDTDEKDHLIRDQSHLWAFEGAAFYAFEVGRQPTGSKPVYRFWNASSGSPFYTIREAEVDMLLADYPEVFIFEGPAFYAYE